MCVTFSLLCTEPGRSSRTGASASAIPSDQLFVSPMLVPFVLPMPTLVPSCCVFAQLRLRLSLVPMVSPTLSLSFSPSVTTLETVWLSVSAMPSVSVSVSLCEEPEAFDQFSPSDQLSELLDPPLRPFDDPDDCVRFGQALEVGSV